LRQQLRGELLQMLLYFAFIYPQQYTVVW